MGLFYSILLLSKSFCNEKMFKIFRDPESNRLLKFLISINLYFLVFINAIDCANQSYKIEIADALNLKTIDLG